MKVLLLHILYIWCAFGQQQPIATNNFQLKLTSERNGPPSKAQYMRIPVVEIAPLPGPKPAGKRPKVGQPPPPPPVTPTKPTRRPKPFGGHVAPPPLPKPVPVDQGLPLITGSNSSEIVPPLPPNVAVVTPMTEVRPELETVATPIEQPTTTPRTMDHLPALYQRSHQNDDLSYFFDFQAANSITRSEQGFSKLDAVYEYPILVKTGVYSFTSPEGASFRVNFIADERGYRTFMSTF